jgi:nitrogen fixation-related uncharacterized protein
MYFPYFIVYISIGVILAVAVLIWAIKKGQFRDQKRARFLPLEDDPPAAPIRTRRVHALEIYGLLFLAIAGLATSAAVLVFSYLISAS